VHEFAALNRSFTTEATAAQSIFFGERQFA
jgi:hypothetical protein